MRSISEQLANWQKADSDSLSARRVREACKLTSKEVIVVSRHPDLSVPVMEFTDEGELTKRLLGGGLSRGLVVCRMQTLISSRLTLSQHTRHHRCCTRNIVSTRSAEYL